MVSVQAKLQERVPGFHFNLGYSGGMFLSGNDEEDEGDWELIKNADKFWWFSHMWLHRQPHKSNTLDQIVEDLKANLEFARVRKKMSEGSTHIVAKDILNSLGLTLYLTLSLPQVTKTEFLLTISIQYQAGR